MRSTARNGTVYVNGTPFHGFGFYHVSWAVTKADRQLALDNMASIGCNVAYFAVDAKDRGFLDRCSALNVQVIIEPNDDNGWQKVVKKFRTHDAVLGWLLKDDINTHPLSESYEMQQQIKALDPHHVTFAYSYTTGENQEYNIADVFVVGYYPLPTEPLYWCQTFSQQAKAANPKALWGVVQAFDSGESAPRPGYPTAAELRQMVTHTMAGDITGLLYYCYADQSGWNITEHPDLWTEIARLAVEWKEHWR